jgi:twitching motility protein PilT
MDQLLKPILDFAVKSEASDIHISAGKPIAFRIHGKLEAKKEAWILSEEKVEKILEVFLHHNTNRIQDFYNSKELDFAFLHTDGTSFRVNAFYRLWKISFVLRRISNTVMTIDELWLPQAVKKFTKAKQWLVLVTWPTGSGKSTSMISLLDEINKTRAEHVLTIEDPVEYIFQDNKSIFSQREIWNDTTSFANALKWAMREDPDVIMIGEMRDAETVQAALELAETWHLVISTLHTSSAVQTISRLVSFFPTETQNAVRGKLADTLVGVLSQRLVPKVWWGRIWLFELMFMSTGIKNLVREGNMNQMFNSIETGAKEWMISMQKYANALKDKWLVLEESYKDYFEDQNNF